MVRFGGPPPRMAHTPLATGSIVGERSFLSTLRRCAPGISTTAGSLTRGRTAGVSGLAVYDRSKRSHPVGSRRDAARSHHARPAPALRAHPSRHPAPGRARATTPRVAEGLRGWAEGAVARGNVHGGRPDVRR